MAETALWWVRDDCRRHDNPVLAAAASEADRLVPVYCFDPADYGSQPYGGRDSFAFEKTGSHRATFRREAVVDLRDTLRAAGSDLVVRTGPPAAELAALAADVDADRLYTQRLPDPEAIGAEQTVREALSPSVDVETRWTHTLYHLEDLPSPVSTVNDTYTAFREAVEADSEVRPTVESPALPPSPDGVGGHVAPGSIPVVADLAPSLRTPPTDSRGVLEFDGGETAGLERLEQYLWERDALRTYKETRNGMLGADYSSKFSPWLAAGCLSPRRIYEDVQRYEADRVANDSTYWLVFELIWRDFFQFQVARYGGQFFAPGSLQERTNIEWRDPAPEGDDTTAAGSLPADVAFERWRAGRTGIPFVDANMRELNATGYLSNRGRQNVASFLVNALRIDWRRGAAYFETQLVDYDPASNYGNWAYIAGVGNDARDRYFDIEWQAERYDPDAEYVTHWLPALDGLPAEYAHKPWTMTPSEQATHGVELGVDYPEPLLTLATAHDHLE